MFAAWRAVTWDAVGGGSGGGGGGGGGGVMLLPVLRVGIRLLLPWWREAGRGSARAVIPPARKPASLPSRVHTVLQQNSYHAKFCY